MNEPECTLRTRELSTPNQRRVLAYRVLPAQAQRQYSISFVLTAWSRAKSSKALHGGHLVASFITGQSLLSSISRRRPADSGLLMPYATCDAGMRMLLCRSQDVVQQLIWPTTSTVPVINPNMLDSCECYADADHADILSRDAVPDDA